MGKDAFLGNLPCGLLRGFQLREHARESLLHGWVMRFARKRAPNALTDKRANKVRLHRLHPSALLISVQHTSYLNRRHAPKIFRADAGLHARIEIGFDKLRQAVGASAVGGSVDFSGAAALGKKPDTSKMS